ncbi:MAG: DUF362 domain-containing protein [Candidatus Heimdallarchaeota archaeon]|nr:DUF362 domain-containing protein [Candidatus Heimdallarchaeota archaeon]
MKDFVVITQAKSIDYLRNYVSLPRSYGTTKYYEREDIQEIIQTVKRNLSELNKYNLFVDQLQRKKVILKPNLVSVQHKFGFQKSDYPETTDPRVIDAIIHFIKPYTEEIVIAESSGRGMPTRLSFKMTGLNRLAKYHNIRLVPLEEQPVDRYFLPKAKVMQEILIPKIFSEVVDGKAFYISIPKMKTNLYTKVTLGFKNSMGIIPYYLRQRDHNYNLVEKLVDILYLLKPDLVIIDGIIGGEGNAPAPVEPILSNVIVSGTNCVETDRVAAKLMGFDPKEIRLITRATKLGFGNPNVTVIGEVEPTPFKPADRSLFSETFNSQYPNVRVLIGHTKNNPPEISSIEEVTPEIVKEIEKACLGGCTASIRTALENIKYQGHSTEFELTIIIGTGIEIQGEKYYFDKKSRAYGYSDIEKLSGKKIAMGNCSSWVSPITNVYISGCMPKPIEPIKKVYKLINISNNHFNPFKNKFLIPYILSKIKQQRTRKRLIKKGLWIDCLPDLGEKNHPTKPLDPKEKKKDYILWPFPTMTSEIKKRFLQREKFSI